MTMRRIILTYGTIAGIILALSLAAAVAIGSHSNTWGMVFGYLTMLIALSMVFVGVKRYRDEELGGVIRFATALKLGSSISLVAMLFYVVGWEIYLFATDYAFAGEMGAAYVEQARAGGASAAEIAALEQDMARFAEWYANPLLRMGITAVELAPVALLMTLLSASLLRNSRFMPARPAA